MWMNKTMMFRFKIQQPHTKQCEGAKNMTFWRTGDDVQEGPGTGGAQHMVYFY